VNWYLFGLIMFIVLYAGYGTVNIIRHWDD
jgi:hypothetical protein